MFGLTSDSALGIEINEHRLLLAEVRKKGDRYTLQKAAQVALPSEVMEDGKIKHPETVAELLRATMRAEGIRCKKAHLVVQSQFVVIRQLQLPDLAHKQLRKVIDFELQSSIHLPFDDPFYDFVSLGKPQEQALEEQVLQEAAAASETETLQDVMLVATSKAVIDPLVEVARLAKLKPQSIDIRALALARTFRKFCGEMEERTTMFVDVAESSTDIHIFQGPVLKFTRNVPIALETYKIDRDADKPLDVLAILEFFEKNTDFRSFTYDLGYEIERSLNFFRYTLNNRDATLATIFLSGLLPKSGVLAQALQERFPDIPVTVALPAGLQIPPHLHKRSEILYEYAVPIGLAVKEVK